MSDQQEREQFKLRVKQAIDLASNGVVAAREYLLMVCSVARMLDDIKDKDAEADVEHLAYLSMYAIPNNEFFIAYRKQLLAAQLIAINAWADSNVMVDGLEKKQADVIRDYVQELFPMVAELTGGPIHRKEVSLSIRRLLLKEN
jgi:hypothetical protein